MPELDLLVLGDVNPDIIVTGDDIEPRFDQVEQLVDSAHLVVGGSAAITAFAARRLGLSTGLAAVVGGDRFGEFVLSEVHDAGVDAKRIRVEVGEATGVTVVLARRADRAILTAPGCISALGAADLAHLLDRPAQHVHVASYYLMGQEYREALPAALRRFRNAGVTVSLDTNWDPLEEWQLETVLAETDIFLPNRAELTAVAGTANVADAMAQVGSAELAVVAKLGDRGAVSWAGGQARSVAAPRTVGFVDAVGAGDCFNAGYLAGLVRSRHPDECLRLAVATGSLSTRGRGGTTAQSTLAEAEELASTLVARSGHQEAV